MHWINENTVDVFDDFGVDVNWRLTFQTFSNTHETWCVDNGIKFETIEVMAATRVIFSRIEDAVLFKLTWSI